MWTVMLQLSVYLYQVLKYETFMIQVVTEWNKIENLNIKDHLSLKLFILTTIAADLAKR